MKFAAKILVLQVVFGVFVLAQSQPTNLQAVSITTSSATLSWSGTGSTSCTVQVAKNSSFNSPTSYTSSSGSVGASSLTSGTVYWWRVKFASGNTWYSGPNFTTIPSPPSDLDIVSVTAIGASVKWNSSAGATSYVIEVHSNASFTSLKWSDSLTSRSATPANLLSGTTYYWRVQAINAGGSSGWSTSRFTTAGSPPPNPPAVPTLSSPSNGATNVAVTQPLSWNASTGASSYRLQVSTSIGFSPTVVDDSTLTGSSRSVGPLSNNTTYYWRVNAKNSGGTSAYSTAYSFTTVSAPPSAPTLSSPASTATGVSITPTLIWIQSSGAISYRLQVAASAQFTTTVVDDSTLTGTSRSVGPLLNNTQYYWRVSAKNSGGTSAFPTAFSFTTIIAAPPAPSLTSPTDNATSVSTSPTMSWGTSSGATSYRLQISTSSDFTSTVLDDSSLTGTSRPVGPLINKTQYYWRVSAKNSGGASSYSSKYSFTTVIAAPPVPSLTSPADTTKGVSTSPTMRWTVSSGATAYHLQLSTSSNFTALVVDDSSISGATRQVSSLSNSTTYYWRVSAINAGGTSSYSTAFSFTTIVSAPSVPTLLSPSNSTTGVSTSPTLSWSTSGGATAYHIQLSLSSSFTTLIVDDSTLSATSRPVGPLINNTQYFWRVCATNAGGASQYSQNWGFTTIVAVPSVPTLSSPANNAGNQPVGLTLSWNAAQGATTYRLQLSTSSNFTPLIVDDSSISGTSRQVSSLYNSTTYYWRVSATNAGGSSQYSPTWNFTTIVAAPSAPVLSTPSNNAGNQPVSLTLTWNASSGATSYRLQLSTSSTFSTTVVEDSSLNGPSRVVGSLNNNTQYYWRVSATNAGGTSQYSPTWSFTTIVAAPGAPTLSSPANNVGDQPVSLTLSWNAATGATSYRVQLSTSTNFTSFVIDSTLTGTSLRAGTFSNSTQYFWRVVASNVGGSSPYSSVFAFTTIVSPPVALDLVSPQNNAGNVSTTPIFTWNESNGAVGYSIQISTASDFSSFVVIQSGITGTSYSAAVLSNNTQYYWRVRATNVGGSGPFSPAFVFTTIVAAPGAPTLTSPVDGATGVSTSPTISWSASLGATSYRLQVSASSGFSSIVLDDSSLTGTSRQGGPLANNTKYYWRARAKNAGGTSAYSSTISFTTIIAVPGGVSGLAATPTTTSASLTWGGVSGASWYIMEVYDADFVSRLSRDSVTSPTSAANGLAPGTSYGWRVQAVNSGGAGVWTTSSFRTPVAVPVAPGNLSSIPNTSGASMSWGLVTGATSYIVQVYTDVTLTTRVFKDSLASPPSLVSSLSASTQYYWRVQSINSGGSSGWTISSFTTSASLPNPPSAPSLSSPADGAVNLAQTVTLNWSAAPNSVSYHLQVSTSSSFSPIVLDTTRITALALSALLNLNTTYHWRVSAINPGGEGSFSATRSFTIVRTTAVERLDGGLATDFTLSQNYPNPFNPTTTIQFSLPSSSNVRITIYNAIGNLVHLLVNGHYAPGQYSVTWDASSLPSGVYFYRIQTESFVGTKRLVLLK